MAFQFPICITCPFNYFGIKISIRLWKRVFLSLKVINNQSASQNVEGQYQKNTAKNAFFRFNLLLMLTKQKRVHSKAQIVPSWLSRWNEKLNACLWGWVAPAPTTPSLQRNILPMNLSICRVKMSEQNLRDSKWQMINDRTTGAHYPHQTLLTSLW